MPETTVEILIRAQENVSQAVNEVKRQLEGLTQHAQSVFGRLTQFFEQNEAILNSLAKTGAVVSGTITALAVVGARYTNQLREEALQIGTTVEKYSLYRAVLEDLEIRAEMLPMFVLRMQVAFQRAAAAVAEKGDKVNELTALMAALGHTIQSQTNDPIEQLVLLLKEIAKIPDQAQQAAIMFELFGRRAYALLPILREGAQEIDDLIQKYKELGVTVGDKTAQKIDNMSDALAALGASLKAHLSDRLADVAPTIEKIADAISKLNAKLKEFKEQHPTLSIFFSHILLLVVGLGMLLTTLGALGNALKWIGDGLKALGATKILDWLKNLVGWFGKLWDVLKAFGGRLVAVVGVPLLTIGGILVSIAGIIRWIDEKTGKISNWLAKLMLPKEMRHLVDEGERDRKEAEEWLRQQEERRRQEEERKKQEKKKEENDYLAQFKKILEDFFGEGKEKEGKPDKKTEKDEWAQWREQILQSQRNIEQRWNEYLDRLEKQRQEWLEFQKKQAEEIKKKYDELIEKQKETYERIARAEEEMRQRMAEAYESAARLAANLAARAGVFHIRFGAFGQFAIPVVQEAQPVAYTPSREEMVLSYTAYIYFYAQQIWLSIQNIIVLLQQAVGHLAFIAQAIAKSSGGATLNVNVPFGYDQIRAAIADAVNETLGKQLAHELVRNA